MSVLALGDGPVMQVWQETGITRTPLMSSKATHQRSEAMPPKRANFQIACQCGQESELFQLQLLLRQSTTVDVLVLMEHNDQDEGYRVRRGRRNKSLPLPPVEEEKSIRASRYLRNAFLLLSPLSRWAYLQHAGNSAGGCVRQRQTSVICRCFK